MHKPTAVPRMPASASGVSTHRSAPKRSRNPAVARKTPPERPTSSPITMTASSRSSSTCNASFTASIISSSAKVAPENPPQLRELVLERRGRSRIRVLEEQPDIGVGLRFRRRDTGVHQLGRLVFDRPIEIVAQRTETAEIALVADQALV